ncbi:MAG TPA: response regulator transcription factor [Thermoleophilaceae bacterium]|nr:response regulator transcription factor [Thermoleophilaceae bacterium]
MEAPQDKVRVLLVDDFALMRQGVTVALEGSGTMSVVGEAETVDEAVALAERLQPDVVVLDMRLPGGGGLVAIDRLREVAPRARILILTASDKPETLIEAVSAGATGYLTKRAGGDELCAAVAQVASGASVVEPSLAGHLMRELAGERDVGGGARVSLTGRERDVMRLVCEGLTDREIGERLFVSTRTVQNDLRRLRDKAGLERRSELVHWATSRSLA